MLLKCISNTGKGLSKKTILAGYPESKEFKDIKVDESYIVYGVCFEGDVVLYLLFGKESKFPDWYPAELFEVINPLKPLIWYYNFYGYNNYVTAIWGYKELVMDPEHNLNLIEKNKEDLKIFLERKQKIDEYEELFLQSLK